MNRRQTPCSALPARARLEAHAPVMMRPSDSPVGSPSVRERWAWSPHDPLLHDTDPSASGLRGPEERLCAAPGRIREGPGRASPGTPMRDAG
jgi:hypothetical protein